MKVLLINRVYGYGSTGKIVKQLCEKATEKGMECYIACRYIEKDDCRHNEKVIAASSWLDCHIHNRLARLTMLQGCFSKVSTFFFLRKIKKINPDIIHLHNIHGSFLNNKLFFKYIKRYNKKVIWTLHDCWAFTGNCRYFEMSQCYKWMDECNKCPEKGEAFLDFSKFMYKKKKKIFKGVQNMTIVTPSQWLADLVKKSFLQEYPIKVINNGIDLNVFKRTDSDFREKYNLNGKIIILGVAFDWNKRKGFDIFLELNRRLDDKYAFVLVGTNKDIDKILPKNFISIHKTNNQNDLAKIYSAADVFVNPTREDNFPTVNIEALACGTPVITFRTGGSPEIIDDTCGSIVECEDIGTLIEEILKFTSKDYTKDCLARAKIFNADYTFESYIELYEKCAHTI